jgi:WD40 repeat protein
MLQYRTIGTLATGADHDSAKLWDLNTGKVRSTLVVSEENLQAVTSISFTPDGKRVAAGIARNRRLSCQAIVWDLATGTALPCGKLRQPPGQVRCGTGQRLDQEILKEDEKVVA